MKLVQLPIVAVYDLNRTVADTTKYDEADAEYKKKFNRPIPPRASFRPAHRPLTGYILQWDDESPYSMYYMNREKVELLTAPIPLKAFKQSPNFMGLILNEKKDDQEYVRIGFVIGKRPPVSSLNNVTFYVRTDVRFWRVNYAFKSVFMSILVCLHNIMMWLGNLYATIYAAIGDTYRFCARVVEFWKLRRKWRRQEKAARNSKQPTISKQVEEIDLTYPKFREEDE